MKHYKDIGPQTAFSFFSFFTFTVIHFKAPRVPSDPVEVIQI